MFEQQCPDALVLVGIDHEKSKFRLSRTHHDVSCAADDPGLAVFLDDSDQPDVIDKVDVCEEGDLLFRKTSPRAKEPPLQGLGSGAGDGCQHVVAILWPKRANFDLATVSRLFDCRIQSESCHRSPLSQGQMVERVASCGLFRMIPLFCPSLIPSS